MRIGVIVNKGFEKAAVSHVRELLDIKAVHVHDTFVVFETDEFEDVYRFVYLNQIANRVVYLVDEFDYSNDDELLEKIRASINESGKNDDFLNRLIDAGADFRSSFKTDAEGADLIGIESDIGGILIDYARSRNKELTVKLKNPLLNFYVYVHNGQAFIGIDLSEDLSKRDYKIFNNAVSLKGPTAFGLLMIAGYDPKDVYLNPACYSGTLEIEAALYASGTSHKFYNKSFPFMKLSNAVEGTDDKYWESFYKKADSKRTEKKFEITGSDKLLSSVTASAKNAKIAGVIDNLTFRRIDTDWMDIKYEERSVDKLISFIPGSSKGRDKELEKEFKQLFYQAEYILNDDGVMVIMCLSKDLLIESCKEHFKVSKQVEVHSGAQPMTIIFFKKK